MIVAKPSPRLPPRSHDKAVPRSSLNLIAALEATIHRVLERLSDDLDGLGLTPGEINALFHIDETNGTRVAVLLDATGQRPSTLTGVVNRLEKRGLITREINPEDRRSFLLRLTPPGAAAAREVRGAFAALETEALDGAPSRTPQGFLAVLHALDNACRPQIEDRDLQTAAPLPGGRRRRRSRLRPGDRERAGS